MKGKKPTPQKVEITNVEECPEFQCVSTVPPPPFIPGNEIKCPDVECPPGYTIKYELGDLSNPQPCELYSCIPPPPKDSICEVNQRTINTFDGTTYKYDICNHILARDLVHSKWDISSK